MTSLTTTRPAEVELDPGPVPDLDARPADKARPAGPAHLTDYDRAVITRARILADVGDVNQCRSVIGDLLITIARMDGIR